MMRIRKILISFILVLCVFLVGCKSKTKEEVNRKVVMDDSIKTVISNHITAIENIPKTVELYKKAKVSTNDYTNEDYINIALNQMVNTHLDTYLTAKEINILKQSNITATSYINANDVNKVVTDLIGPKTIDKVLSIDGCPSYTYDAKTNRYFVNNVCNNSERIISYIQEITYDGNEYYATVYVGYVLDDVLYNDVNKNNEITKLDNEGSYSISNDNKEKFSKYIYKFRKNSDGNYIFESIEK